MSATLKYTVVSRATGREYKGRLGYDIKKTLDRRGDNAPVQIVYECLDRGVWVRVWTDECAGVSGEVMDKE